MNINFFRQIKKIRIEYIIEISLYIIIILYNIDNSK